MIKVVAKIYLKEEPIEEALSLYTELIQKTRLEKGCISYLLCEDLDNPTNYVMLEEWEDRACLEAHFASEHFKNLVPKIGKFVRKETEVTILKKKI